MYKALYRKYRSKTFDELYGQEAVVASLKNQVKNNEISHAYIFQGTRGTGKTSAAKILSRAVNCLHPVNGNPCNECENCKRILNESVLDVVEMDAASNNGVDDIRDLKDKVIYPPQALKYKVYIIDEVHMLSKGAFNALLKILEEPPRHLIFILATTEIEKIPATILSRSQKFNFKRISVEDIESNLKRITELEGKSCDEEVFTLIAKTADGAMRDALSVLDQLLTKNEDHIKLEDAMEVLGISSSELLFSLSKAMIEKNINGSLHAIDEIYREGIDFSTLSSQILNHFRDILLVKTLKDPRKIVYTTYLKEFQNLAGSVELEDLLNIIEILKELSFEIKYADNKRVVFEMNAIKICKRSNREDLEVRIKLLEDKINNLGRDILSNENSNIPSNNIEDNFNNYENNYYNPGDFYKEDVTPRKENANKSFVENKRENIKDDESPRIEKSKQSAIIENDNTKNLEEKKDRSNNITLDRIKSDWDKIINELISRGFKGFAGFVGHARPESLNGNILELVFEEKDSLFYEYCIMQENKKILPDLLNNVYNTNIDVRMKLKKGRVDKLEEIFGKDNIEEI
ncbi:DNA polymerase III subunit gamma/tau [uncultured Peptoniphilus sp.]|uniref:DNA polymerase III subunit gamma/tau n=1 Tax=uncultured Peptoniphilus sp. TaxID=254354 RepID=UPI0025F7A53F|nr:DNA polymerase III subunit gamma/tau [uncultured Peptoniphilus sp.]